MWAFEERPRNYSRNQMTLRAREPTLAVDLFPHSTGSPHGVCKRRRACDAIG